MCIGEPMRVEAAEGMVARCRDRFGNLRSIDLLLVGEQPPGTWLLVFLDAARDVIDEARARMVREALEAVTAVMNGSALDIDTAFADLIGREPQLPDFLKEG